MYAVHVKRTGTKLIYDKFRPERRYAVYDGEDSMGELLIAVKYGAPLSPFLSSAQLPPADYVAQSK